MANSLSVEDYVDGIFSADRTIIGKAVSLAESTLPADKVQARKLIDRISKKAGDSVRIGITGTPGAGKSTFTEAFGKHITGLGKKVAVITVDPSSRHTKGSILGDKTRMQELSIDPNAFIRPAPSGRMLGGIAQGTFESILIFEAAGYDMIIVETTGVGQSETAVLNLTDFFLLLTIPGAGDELQGIKRGITEVADMIVVNKADGDNLQKAKLAQTELKNALHYFITDKKKPAPKVLTCSALQKTGIEAVSNEVEKFISETKKSGWFEENRRNQRLYRLRELIRANLMDKFYDNKSVNQKLGTIEKEVRNGKLLPEDGAELLLKQFLT